MSEAKYLDCICVEDEYVTVVVVKKQPSTESDRDAIGRAINLLRKE